MSCLRPIHEFKQQRRGFARIAVALHGGNFKESDSFRQFRFQELGERGLASSTRHHDLLNSTISTTGIYQAAKVAQEEKKRKVTHNAKSYRIRCP